MKETGLTGLNAGGQMTDAAMERLPRLDFVTALNLDVGGKMWWPSSLSKKPDVSLEEIATEREPIHTAG